MSRMKAGAAVAGALLFLAGCGGGGRHVAADPPPPNWRLVATPADRDRLRNWRDVWEKALAKAAPGHAAQIAGTGAILQPDAALIDPLPPVGDYRCRTFKIGAKATGNQDYVEGAPTDCRIEQKGALLRFRMLTGLQRPVGKLYPATPDRMIFLGTLVLSDETMAMQYGRDPDRDTAGAFERIGDRHWRLVLPSPQWEAMLDVIDIVPAG